MDKDKGVLLIDLDGTLAKREQPFNPYSVGEPVEKLLKAALAEKAKGRKIVCFTARAASKDKKMHATVRAWLDKHGLEGVEITNEKDRHTTEIWDDRARGVVPDKGVFTDGKKASDAKKKTAVIIKGNPKFVTGNAKADAFYKQVQDKLEAQGFAVSTDPGLPHTAPPDADLWVGHSRGGDRLRWAPEGTRTLRLDDFLPEGHDQFPEGGAPGDAHYTLTPEIEEALAVDPDYHEDGQATLDGEKFEVNDLLQSAGAPAKYPVDELKWILEHDKPDAARVANAKRVAGLVYTDPKGRTVVADGLQRLARAVQEGRKHIAMRPVELPTKQAKTMVRKERVEIQHDDHCPHCDHKFSEKGYPRPDFSKLPEDPDERQRMILNGDCDDICPRCNGIVDPIEMTDEEIDSYQESPWLSKDALRKRRDKRHARIAARENVKEASLNKALVAGAAGAGIGGAVQLARRFMQSEDDRETHGAPSIINGMLVGGGAGALVGGLLPQTTTQVAAPAPPVPTAQQALTPQQINEILSGSLSLAEAQHTYHTHVSKGQFAPNIKALGSVGDKGGTVMAHRTWNASDAVPKPVPVHGYTYTLAPVAAGKEGVAIVAHAPQGPSYLSWLKDLKGGMIGATSAPTWEVPADHSSKLLELLRRNAAGEDLSQFSPEKMPGTRLLENFGLPAAPGMDKKSAAGGFQRPENYDCISKLEKCDVEIWAGANDWEEANTWMWAVHRPKGPDVNNESMVWVELKYPDLPHPGDDVSSEDLDKLKRLAKRLPKEWEAEAKKIESPPTLEAFEKALQSTKLKPFVAASGFKDSRDGMRKWASAVPSSPQDTDVRGPRRLLQMLQNVDLAKLEAQAIADAKSGKITKRDKAVKILSAIEGLKRTNIKPEELMITRVPVLPPNFRPFSTMGTTFIPGSANELYQDLFRHRQAHKETLRELGEDMAGNTRLNLLNAVRALYGYGDPVSPKLQGRETKGYLKQILGSGGPKTGYFQRKLISRPIDSIGRGVITVDPDLDMNQISIPEELAWETYGSHVQRRLVQSLGMKPVEALKMVKDRTKEAQLALKQEMSPETGRPVIYSRAPAWHKFNTVAGWPKMHTGHNIAINPYVTAGAGADFDGDAMNVSVPILPESVEEAKKKLMPDKMLFTIRDQESVMSQPKHEMVLGLYTSATRPSGRVFQFGSKQKAIAAVENGDVNYDDDIEFPGD